MRRAPIQPKKLHNFHAKCVCGGGGALDENIIKGWTSQSFLFLRLGVPWTEVPLRYVGITLLFRQLYLSGVCLDVDQV